MAKLKCFQTSLVAGALSGLLIGCGASRSNKFSACSSLKAVADFGTGAPKTLRTGESYDPSSVMLLFRASSDKISIESRCNARLMHKLLVKNSSAPVDFAKVDFALSGVNEGALELHTSAHCFFRIWDSRVASQVENNPELSENETKKILSDDFERYKLYKSLLTSPQKIYAFSSSGEPIEFEYKLKNATGIYAAFFEKIDEYKDGSVNEYVGREFSKTSIMLDELALDVCSADEKLAKRTKSRFEAAVANGGLNPDSLNEFRSDTAVKDLARRKAIHNGKHKICLSQSDLVVAPITLISAPSEQQQAHLGSIHTHQRKKVDEYRSALFASVDPNPPASAEEIKLRYVSEFLKQTKPSSLGNSCSWSSQYPALSVPHPLMDDVSTGLNSWSSVTQSDFDIIMQSILSKIPDIAPILSSIGDDALLRNYVNEAPKQEACRIRGGTFNKATLVCSERTNSSSEIARPEFGFCPPSDPSDTSKFKKEAARIHLSTNASLRLATVNALQVLERYRTASDDILLLPLASLYGITSHESKFTDTSKAKVVFGRLSELKQDKFIGARELVVERVDEESIPVCSLHSIGTALGAEATKVSNVSTTFDNFSDSAVDFMKNKVKSNSFPSAYANFAVRYLNTRCIGAGLQLLYNGWEQMPGLMQNIGFADVSVVLAGAVPGDGKTSPSTKELLESARTVSVPFSSLILGHEFSSNAFPQQIGAKLMASGHMQIGLCVASERIDAPDQYSEQFLVNGSFDADKYREAVLEYNRLSKNLFCEASPGHREYVERVKQKRALYETSPDGLGPIFDELNYPASPFIYEKMSTKAVADALPRMFGHLNFITAVPNWLPDQAKEKYGVSVNYVSSFRNESGRYFLTAGDSGTTISMFGLFPVFMLSTVQDVPVSGGIAVVPSTSGQEVQSGKGSGCR